jgi:hypothetical protein
MFADICSKNRTSLFAAILALLLLARGVAAQSAATDFDRDGRWWLAANDIDGGQAATRGVIKITYLSGLLDGAKFLGS